MITIYRQGAEVKLVTNISDLTDQDFCIIRGARGTLVSVDAEGFLVNFGRDIGHVSVDLKEVSYVHVKRPSRTTNSKRVAA